MTMIAQFFRNGQQVYLMSGDSLGTAWSFSLYASPEETELFLGPWYDQWQQAPESDNLGELTLSDLGYDPDYWEE